MTRSNPITRNIPSPNLNAQACTDLWKARQLKEYRRLHNLCFKCGEKYNPTNTCAPIASNLNVMETSAVDGGGILFEELLVALEPSQMFMMQDDCFLSLHALSGISQHMAIQLRALVQNKALINLVDSRSSHTFLNLVVANKLQLPIVHVFPCQSMLPMGP
jgi:hypothetical protein